MPLFSTYNGLHDISSRLTLPALVFSIVTPLVVLFRFIARCTHGNHLGADDWVILASFCFAEAVSVLMIICCEWGFGKHTKELPRPLVTRTLELYFAAQIFYKVTFTLTKTSILLLYLRVFGIWRAFRFLCWIMIGVVLSFTTASVFASIFQCSPVAFAFDNTTNDGHGTCIDLTTFWYANAGFNIGTDVIIIIMPIWPVKGLNIPTRSKIALCGVFAVGIIVCITSILRFTTLNHSTSHTDIMWQSIASSMWTVIEYNLGIIAASMPALRRPFASLFPLLLGRRERSFTHHKWVDEANLTRAPSTISRASTKTSTRHSTKPIAWYDDAYGKNNKVMAAPVKDDRHRSGVRTEFFEQESGTFDIDSEKGECTPKMASGDSVSKHDWQTNEIWKTTEVDVEPSSRNESRDEYTRFPK